MSDSSVPKATSKPPRSRFSNWAARLLIAVAVLVVVLVVALFSARAYFRHTGQRDLHVEMARLDAEDPSWRWDDLDAGRAKAAPPEAENSAVLVREVRAMMPKEWNEWVNRPNQPQDQEPAPLNRQFRLEDLTRDRELADLTRKARDRGLALKDYPRGFHPVNLTDMPFIESLDETQGTREVAHLMKVDVFLAAQDGDPIRALRASRAILNAGRSIGDEPSIISSLVRFACGMIAAESAMRVVGLTHSKDALPELALLQAAFVAEAEESILLNGLRGERAIMNRFFDGVNTGRITPDQMARMGDMKPSPEHRFVMYFLNAFLPEDQRRYLVLMSELIDAAKKPYAEQVATATRIETELRANRDIRYRWHALMLPAVLKVLDANTRHRATLLCAAMLIACERFRLSRGRWPESLAELPKDLLPAIPTDPFTGELVKFAKLPDGIAVYCLSPKEIHRHQKRVTNPLGGDELGWRLYDPEHRALPPLPKPILELPDVPGPNDP